MPRTEILLTAPMLLSTMAALDECFLVHKLWEASDQSAFIGQHCGRIEGMATSGSFGTIDAALLDRLPALQIIASLGVGYENIDTGAALARGVVVTNSPGECDAEVADFTVGLLLSTIRQLPSADRFVRDGRWPEERFPLTATLRGRRIGIIGMGNIGQTIARRLKGFDVEIAYHGRSRKAKLSYNFYTTPQALAADSDVLIVAVPGGHETRQLIDATVLRALGSEGILINVSRGSVVDERALIRMLSTGGILAAGLDVFENEPHVPAELIALPNTVLLPHAGSASLHTRESMGRALVENLRAWFAGAEPPSLVPETAHLFRRRRMLWASIYHANLMGPPLARE